MNWFTWSLLSAGFAGATVVLAKIGITGIEANLATAIRTSFVLVFTWAAAVHSGPVSAIAGVSRRAWLFLALSGVATAASWLCYFRALQIGEASQVAPVDKLSIVFVVVFAAIFLGEVVTWKTVAGAGLIASGAALLALK
jgi:transporter family protein